MSRIVRKNAFFLVSLVLIMGLSSIRSSPVYGKLDFILLEGRAWWIPWRPMIETIVSKGDRLILSDMITCTILRGVFAQQAVAFRFDRRYSHVQVEKLLESNRDPLFPFGALCLLLHDNLDDEIVGGKEEHYHLETSAQEVIIAAAMRSLKQRNTVMNEKKYPYRCLINLHGFKSSWVPEETGHWSPKWAEPSLMYEFQGKRGKDIEPLLRENLPENCMVYF